MAGVIVFSSGGLLWDPCLGQTMELGHSLTNDNLSIDVAKVLHVWHSLQKQSQEQNSCEGKHVEKH